MDDLLAGGSGFEAGRRKWPKFSLDAEPLEARVHVLESDALLNIQLEFEAVELAPDQAGSHFDGGPTSGPRFIPQKRLRASSRV